MKRFKMITTIAILLLSFGMFAQTESTSYLYYLEGNSETYEQDLRKPLTQQATFVTIDYDNKMFFLSKKPTSDLILAFEIAPSSDISPKYAELSFIARDDNNGMYKISIGKDIVVIQDQSNHFLLLTNTVSNE